MMNAKAKQTRPDQHQLPQLHRLAGSRAVHVAPRHRHAGTARSSAISREYYHYDSEKTFKYNNIEQGNRNPLVQRGIADGLKTGHTEAGGYGLVASALRDGRRVILVLNGMTTHARARRGKRAADGLGVLRISRT